MENNLDDLFNIEMSPKLRDDLRTTANWGKIIGIVGFVSAFCTFMVYLKNGSFITGLISAIFSVFIYIFLFKFGVLTKKGIDDNDQESMNSGLAQLASYFKIIACLLIIGSVVCVLALAIALLARK